MKTAAPIPLAREGNKEYTMHAFDRQLALDGFANSGAALGARRPRRDRPRGRRWLIAGLLAGYIWGLGSRADIVREAGYKEGAAAAWAACSSRQSAALDAGGAARR